MVAENRFEMTRKLYESGMKCISGYRKMTRRVFLILIVLWLVLAAMTVAHQPGYAVIEGVVLLLVALWIGILLPKSRAKRAYRGLEAAYGSDMTRTIRFLPEEMEIETGGTVSTVPYTDVTSVLHEGGLTVLLCRDKRGILLKDDSYTQGDWPAVEALLEEAKNAATEEED